MSPMPVEPKLSEYLHRKAAHLGIALNGTFELTPVCNMNCKMCYVRMSAEQQRAIRPLRSAEEWLELGRKCVDAGMVYLLLTGGEPFLHPQFREILTGLHRMGLIISINSNGTLIDEETVQWLKTVAPSRINMTLYGASDETYARLCGNPKGFTQAVKAIRLLKEAGIRLKINCSVTPHNVRDMAQIVAFTKAEELPLQMSTYMFPPLRKDPTMIGRNDRFTPEEAAYYMAVNEYLQNGQDYFLAVPEDQLPPLTMDLEEDCAECGDQIRCRAGKCSFWITWEGYMMPCGMFPSQGYPNVFETEFAQAWDQVKQSTGAIRLPVQCAQCNLKDTCKACAAMVVTETGCFHQVPQYRCAMAQAFRRERDRLKAEIISRQDHSLEVTP